MPATRYQKAVKALKHYMETSKRDFIYTQDLRALIIKEIGSTENTVFGTLNMLREMKVIKEIELHKWKIRLEHVNFAAGKAQKKL